jgi:MSHA biogenesis protein MshP
MCRNKPASHRRRVQCRGFALPTAIFLMVILAALGAYIARVNLLQSSSSALDVLGSGAYQAARAGAEWGAYNSLHNTTCATSTSLTFAGTALASFTATVTCIPPTPPLPDELGVTVTIDKITSIACNEPLAGVCPNSTPTNANYTERSITITVSR